MFDKQIAEEYDAWYNSKLGAFVDETETKCAFDLLQPSDDDKILDVGCGTGNFSLKLAGRCAKVIGVDISDAMLQVAQNKIKNQTDHTEFRKMDAHHLEFEDNSFDSVLSMATIEFVEDPQQVFDEMFRVVKPGGHIVIGAIHRNSPWGEMYKQLAEEGDPVFGGALLKSRDELTRFDRENLVKIDSCLYLPPDVSEDEISWEEEKKRQDSAPAGFLCALWRKPE